MTFTPIKEIQKIALEKYNEKVDADFQKLVECINYNIQEEANQGKFFVVVNILAFVPAACFRAKVMLKEQGYICSITGSDLYISWDNNEIYSN